MKKLTTKKPLIEACGAAEPETPVRLTSTHALVAIKIGRRALDKALPPDMSMRLPVTLNGYLNYAWGRDDGTDQEFQMDVTDFDWGGVEENPAKKAKTVKKVKRAKR